MTMPAQRETLGRILLAEDDEMFRQGLARQLQAAGYDCAAVAGGAEVLEILKRETFDLLLSDIHMPGNAGLELVRALPAAAPGLPVILLTGQPTIDTAVESVRLPVFAYLIKPPDKQQLLETVAAAVVAGRTHRAVRASRERLRSLDVELGLIEQGLAKPAPENVEPPATGFVRLTLRNLAISLSDLERSLGLLGGGTGQASDVEKAELLSAVRHTVEVLEKTRRSFKSRELGELRHQLEALLPKE